MQDPLSPDYLTIKISQDKKTQLENWCQQKNLEPEQIINLFIDACLTEKIQLINDLFPANTNFLTQKEIDFIISQSLKPLIERLEKLEQNNVNIDNKQTIGITKINSVNNNSYQQEILKTEWEIPEEERKYLPRHEVWQMLKKTDYVKSCGYDSFLSATPYEFIEYGIFFDTNKKRYYIKNNS